MYDIYVKAGEANGKKLIFVLFPPNHDLVHLRFRAGTFTTNQVSDLISGEKIPVVDTNDDQDCIFPAPSWRFALPSES